MQETNREQILDDLYAGVEDAEAMKRAFDGAVKTLGASGGNIHIVSKGNLETLLFAGWGDGYTDQSITEYLNHWQYVNAHRDLMRRANVNNDYPVFLCHEHITEEDWSRGSYFQDFFSKIGQRWLAGGIVWSDASNEVSIAFSRPQGSPPFDEKSRAFLEFFLPHVRRAARLGISLGAHSELRTISLDNAFSSARTPSFLLDEACNIHWQNSACDALLDSDGPVSEYNGKLVFSKASDAASLRALLSNTVQSKPAETPAEYMKLQCGDFFCDIEVMPATIPSGSLTTTGRLALVMIRPIGLTGATLEQLKTQYGLTNAESRLAIALAEGESVEQASARMDISQHTVRAQLKSIFSKTGVNRQSALTALIWRSA